MWTKGRKFTGGYEQYLRQRVPELSGIFSDNLSWHEHIDYIVNKASRSLGFIRRKYFLASTETRLLAFKSIVRSQLEQAGIIWAPYQDNLINKIERNQTNGARFIFKDYSPCESVTALKLRPNLPSLDARRQVYLVAFIRNIYCFNVPIKERLLLPPYIIVSGHDHPHKIGLTNTSY